jgi:UDP-N-acetylglucosamine 2-epimerase (non-hydrolysing)
LLAPLFDWFGIRVDADLEVMQSGQTLSELTSRLLPRYDAFFSRAQPGMVVGQGDTTSVFCAALSCFYRKITFAHVEAGLRTHDIQFPFPEEFNRVAVGRLAQLHFCPTQLSMRNLENEGVPASWLYLTGNTVVDALYLTRAKLPPASNAKAQILLTAHRRENFGAPLERIFRAVLRLCAEFPEISVIYPVHPNPSVMEPAYRLLGGHPQIALTKPMNYPDMVAAMNASRFILTDSGGIQEEAPALGKPVIVLRGETERSEAVESGAARLAGTDEARILEECRALLENEDRYRAMSQAGSPYGDGHAAKRIVKIIAETMEAGTWP